MANLTTVHIKGVDYDFWTHDGVISGVRDRSETQVWSSGGGGYVDPKYGGVVHAPTVHSRTDHWKEVRLDGNDGKGHSFVLPDHVSVFPGDHVSIISASPHSHKTGHVHAVFNFREDSIWTFNTEDLVKPEYRKTIGGYVMRFWTKGIFSWLAATTVLGLLDQTRMFGLYFLLDPVWIWGSMTNGMLSERGLVLGAVALGIGTIVRMCHSVAKYYASKASKKALLQFARSLPRPQQSPASVEAPAAGTVLEAARAA